jgi:hypothetical protein
MMVFITSLIAIFFAGFSEGIMDKLQFHYHKSKFKNYKNQNFWDPSISWSNKWSNHDPKNGPAFFGSSTFLVFLTDSWHLFKFLKNTLIFIGLILLGFYAKSVILLILFFIISRSIYGLGFSFSFYKIFNN